MKKLKKIIPMALALALTAASLPLTARADSSKVVTLGANLTEEQKTSMYQYFGTTANEVATIEVNNADERKYMEGIATEAQIGTRTYSCSYVEPTTEGGIQVKVANLTFVTSSMIASTLLTSGVENCNVVAASPIAVSGTGALTGIMMAYENASGKTLSEDQKATATQELVTTGDLAQAVGQEKATDLMNEVKEKVIKDGIKDEAKIQDTISDKADDLGVTLTADQMAQISSLMQSISQYDYDVKALKKTLDNLDGKSDGFFSSLWTSIKNVFSGSDDEGGIINDTDDSVLGDNAVIDSTLEAVKDKVNSEEGEGFFGKIANFFKELFGGDDSEEKTEENTEENPDASEAAETEEGAAENADGTAAEAESANGTTEAVNGTEASDEGENANEAKTNETEGSADGANADAGADSAENVNGSN